MMRREQIRQKVMDQLIELINSGEISSEGRLPSERRLAKKFQVSRSMIRSVKRALQSKGLIEIRPYSGAYVRKRPLFILNDISTLKPLELIEAHALVETEAVALAARVIKHEGISNIKNTIALVRSKEYKSKSIIEIDATFYKAVEFSTENHVFISVLNNIWHIWRNSSSLMDSLHRAYEKVYDRDISQLKDHYDLVLKAFEQNTPDIARRATQSHFSRIIEAVLHNLEDQAYKQIEVQKSLTRSRYLLCTNIS